MPFDFRITSSSVQSGPICISKKAGKKNEKKPTWMNLENKAM